MFLHIETKFQEFLRLSTLIKKFNSELIYRTILALWKAKYLSPEQKVRIVEEESEAKCCLQTEESGSFLGLSEVSMSEVLTSTLSVPVSSLSLSVNFVYMNLRIAHFSTLVYYHVYFM